MAEEEALISEGVRLKVEDHKRARVKLQEGVRLSLE